MARLLRMPGVAANTTEAVLAEWLVRESVDFAAAEAIATVETEKAAVDIEADAGGRVLKTLVPPGAQVEVGDPIAVIGDPGEQVDDLDALLTSLGVTPAAEPVMAVRREVPEEPAAPTVAVARAVPAPAPTATSPTATPKAPAASAPRRIFSSPLARKIAKEHGLSIEQVAGTGPRGRVLRRDVDAAAAQAVAPGRQEPVAPEPEPALPKHASPGAAFEEVPHSRMRIATARRLTESKQQAPHFYLRTTVRVERLLALRGEINGDGVSRVSVNDLVVRAVALAHQRVPEMNVTWTPDAVRRYSTVDVGIAVATERGLMTPLIRDVASMTVTAVAAATRDAAERAREGRLKQDELEGGSICVTNLGMYGVEEFAAIINPPQAAILAVGAVRDEPVVEDGAVVAGQVMTLTLSVDHRPVDGVLAARWLAELTAMLEHPVRILA